MAAGMTKAQARAWKKRWEAVNAFQREELRKTPIQEKFRQLASLMASGKQLGWDKRLAGEDAIVWNRWNLLRKRWVRLRGDGGQ